MNIFISYRSIDRAIVNELATDLSDMEHRVWYDRELEAEGGQNWWDNILQQIRHCDVLTFALTPEALDSYACQLEYTYANALKKHIVPVKLAAQINVTLLPVILQQRQIVDYVNRDKASFKALANALRNLPSTPLLPDPLPAPPPVPISPLAPLKTQIDSPVLTYEQQSAILIQLKGHMQNPQYAKDARDLLQRLSDHPMLLAPIFKEIAVVLATPATPTAQRPPDSKYAKPASKPVHEQQANIEAIFSKPETGQTAGQDGTATKVAFDLGPGEQIIKEIPSKSLNHGLIGLAGHFGSLYITNQRVGFRPSKSANARDSIDVPLEEITNIEKMIVYVEFPIIRISVRSGKHYDFTVGFGNASGNLKSAAYGNREEVIQTIQNAMSQK